MTTCGCKCHAGGPHATCDVEHDTGSSGVPGKPSCSPCFGGTSERVPLDQACIMGHPEPAEREFGHLCRRHYHWIDRTLNEILELYALLPDVRQPVVGGGDGRSATRVGSPAPGRIEVMALTDKRVQGRNPPMTYESNWNASTATLESNGREDDIDFMGVLGGWMRMVEEEREIAPAERAVGPTCADDPCRHISCMKLRGYVSLTTIVRMLRRDKLWIAQQPWADLFCEEIGDAHRALARAVGTNMWPEPIGKCPNCQRPLYNTIGLDEVTCRKCKASWSGIHLARLKLIHDQEAAS